MAQNLGCTGCPPPWIKRAMVALARRIGVILRRMWIEDTDFCSDDPSLNVA